MEVREIANALEKMVNNYGHDGDAKEFAERIVLGTHRTLQQSIMKVFLGVFKLWAEMYREERYDARNEATVKLANDIVTFLEIQSEENGRDVTYLPFISD